MKPIVAIVATLTVLSTGIEAGRIQASAAQTFGLPSRPLLAAPTIGRDPDRFVLGDTVEIVARRLPLLGISGGYALAPDPLAALRTKSVRYPFQPKPDYQLRRPVPVFTLLSPKRVELSRFSCAVEGGELGAGAASSLAGLGLVSGFWGQKTAGYLLGVGAVLGALWGGTMGASDPDARIRIGLDDPAAQWDRYRSRPDDDQRGHRRTR